MAPDKFKLGWLATQTAPQLGSALFVLAFRPAMPLQLPMPTKVDSHS